MFKNPWNDCVARAEHDHRAREVRLRLECCERAFDRVSVGKARLVRLIRLLSLRVSGSGGTDEDGFTGPMNDQGSYIVVAVPFPHPGLAPGLQVASGSVLRRL